MHFEGVIPALVTPFGEDGSVDTAALARHAEWLLENGATGLVGTGTMGEAQSMSASERRLVIETLVEAADGRVTVTAGVSSGTPASSIAFAADAATVGAGALMLLPPLGYPGDEREIEAFYRDVASASGMPVMAYNNPKASGTDMLPALIARLAEIDGIAAVKECSGDARRIAEVLNATDDFEVLVGGDDWALEGFCAGATGWISGVANVAPRECADLYRLCSEGNLESARELHGRLLPLGRLDMKPKLVQYFKAAMDIVGREGGPCRPPRLELTAEEQREVEEAVRALGAGVAG
jgi:4-hydroxy-tetrahydrodipicolinate synthase